jgi:hypothetical protein
LLGVGESAREVLRELDMLHTLYPPSKLVMVLGGATNIPTQAMADNSLMAAADGPLCG